MARKFSDWKHLYDEYLRTFGSDPPGKDPPERGSLSQAWMFRGQSNTNWDLTTRLERELTSAGCPVTKWRYFEEGLVREFQRRVQTAEPDLSLPEAGNVLEWMSLMQHHGTPTRLLDWTHSFFVALFFAVESASTDAAVYAIDGRWCNRTSRKRLPDPGKATTEIAKDPYFTNSTTFKSVFARRREIPLVYRVNAFHLNPRLAIQQGAFLCPGALTKTFEANLESLESSASPKQPPLHKWTITKNCHADVLRQLSYMNIGRHSLFPGLDGFAQSLTQYLRQGDRLYPPWRQKQPSAPFEKWGIWAGWKG